MSHRPVFFFFVLLFLINAPVLPAQLPPADIRPLLKTLTADQKLQLLEYLRHLGSNIDDEIQQAYREHTPKNQRKAADFLETLRKSKTDQPTTSVDWDRDTIFFKEITAGARVLDSFRVTNTGNYPYLISQIQTTCDCAIFKAPKYPVMPGESALLRVEFNSLGKAGTATPAIVLTDNSAPNRRTILYLNGRVKPRKFSGKYPWDD